MTTQTPNAPALPERAWTPGPWRAERFVGDWKIFGNPAWPCNWNDCDGVWPVAIIDDTITDDYPREAEANARLIAAAPALYEALERLLAHWTGEAGPTEHDDDDAMERKARAALALARTGEAK